MATTAQIHKFPQTEAPTNRFAQLAQPVNRRHTVRMNASQRAGGTPPTKKDGAGSGTRKKIASPTCDELERMASFVTLYTSLRRELDNVLDPSRVLVLTGQLPEELDTSDDNLTSVLRLVNGVSSVEDVIESSGLDRAHAVSVICTLIVARAIMMV